MSTWPNLSVQVIKQKKLYLTFQEGSMIREMAARSCGAQIKILSSKEQERLLQDCVVTIAGSLANKQDAACIILEKI